MHDYWQSPLTCRYGSDQLKSIWSEKEKRKLWRRVWVALAQAQSEFGLVSNEELEDIESKVDSIDVETALGLEHALKHDLVAELRTYAAQCPVGGRILHLGATSMDIEDNADALRIKASLQVINKSLCDLLATLAQKIEDHAEHVTMGFTHLQPAEPTTVGYRFAQWAQDLLEDLKGLAKVSQEIRGKGIKGAVGTGASYVELLGSEEKAQQLESRVMSELGLRSFYVTTQVYPRKQDLVVLNALSNIGQSLYRLAYDVRLLQGPGIGELREPFGAYQVGSSAMPFKQNPVMAENIDSLARQLASLPRIAWDNAAHCHLERTLDDSANRRSLLPEAFLLVDALLRRTKTMVEGLEVDPRATRRLLEIYGPFAATERVLMEAVKGGADRQEFHDILRHHSLDAWSEVRTGGDNRLLFRLKSDEGVTRYVSPKKLQKLLDASSHTGYAAQKAKSFLGVLRLALQEPPC